MRPPTTVRAIGELDRAFSQRRFVSSVHQSYGDALFAPEHEGEHVRPWLRVIVADGEPVGFMMVAEPMAAARLLRARSWTCRQRRASLFAQVMVGGDPGSLPQA